MLPGQGHTAARVSAQTARYGHRAGERRWARAPRLRMRGPSAMLRYWGTPSLLHAGIHTIHQAAQAGHLAECVAAVDLQLLTLL